MRVDGRLGTFEKVAAAPPACSDLSVAVRAAVAEIHPDVVEIASRRERSVWWGWGPGRVREGYAYVIPHARHVTLGFFQGVSPPGPEGVLEGTGKALRHVKLRGGGPRTRPAPPSGR